MVPSAAVVVPAYHEADALDPTLSSLEDQPGEVIVVYAGAETGRVARQHDRTDMIIEDTRTDGPGAARNMGAEESTAEVVLFTDAETIVPPDWVESHCRHYQDEAVVGVGGPVRPRSDALKHRVLFKILSDYWYRVSWPFGFYQLSGWNCSYRRADFLEEGGFDASLPFMEDTELSLRMKEYGRLVYDPSCWTATSVRRQEKQGYLPLFLQYARAYCRHYLLDRDIDTAYFPSNDDLSAEDTYKQS